MDKRIVIIGLGEIGSANLEDMLKIAKEKKLKYDFYGVDINDIVLNNLKKKFPNVTYSKDIPKGDIYIILVYTNEQVESVINNIQKDNNPLIIIESTIFPKTIERLRDLYDKDKNFSLALFPHRFNPDDKEHRVFNLHRIIGGVNEESVERALDLYKDFMSKELLTIVPFEIAALSKVVENAYRFIEIAIAEEFKTECDRLNIDFNELRKSVNTKWNINLKEARDGIDRKCLPKDVNLLNDFFKTNKIIRTAIEVNEEYKKKNQGGKNEEGKPASC